MWVAEPGERADLEALVAAYLLGTAPHPPIAGVVDFYLAAKAAAVCPHAQPCLCAVHSTSSPCYVAMCSLCIGLMTSIASTDVVQLQLWSSCLSLVNSLAFGTPLSLLGNLLDHQFHADVWVGC